MALRGLSRREESHSGDLAMKEFVMNALVMPQFSFRSPTSTQAPRQTELAKDFTSIDNDLSPWTNLIERVIEFAPTVKLMFIIR
jgi:hypothetical protein